MRDRVKYRLAGKRIRRREEGERDGRNMFVHMERR